MTVRPRSLLHIAAVPPPCQPHRPLLAPLCSPQAHRLGSPSARHAMTRTTPALLLLAVCCLAAVAKGVLTACCCPCWPTRLSLPAPPPPANWLLSRSAGFLQAASCTRPLQQPPHPHVCWRCSAALQVRSTLIDRTSPAAPATILTLILSALAPALSLQEPPAPPPPPRRQPSRPSTQWAGPPPLSRSSPVCLPRFAYPGLPTAPACAR